MPAHKDGPFKAGKSANKRPTKKRGKPRAAKRATNCAQHFVLQGMRLLWRAIYLRASLLQARLRTIPAVARLHFVSLPRYGCRLKTTPTRRIWPAPYRLARPYTIAARIRLPNEPVRDEPQPPPQPFESASDVRAARQQVRQLMHRAEPLAQQDRYVEAAELLGQAAQLLSRIEQNPHKVLSQTELNDEIQQLHSRLAFVYHSIGHLSQAVNSYDRAISALRTICSTGPTNAHFFPLISTLINFAECRALTLRDFFGAHKLVKEAIELLEHQLSRPTQFPRSSLIEALAIACGNLVDYFSASVGEGGLQPLSHEEDDDLLPLPARARLVPGTPEYAAVQRQVYTQALPYAQRSLELFEELSGPHGERTQAAVKTVVRLLRGLERNQELSEFVKHWSGRGVDTTVPDEAELRRMVADELQKSADAATSPDTAAKWEAMVEKARQSSSEFRESMRGVAGALDSELEGAGSSGGRARPSQKQPLSEDVLAKRLQHMMDMLPAESTQMPQIAQQMQPGFAAVERSMDSHEPVRDLTEELLRKAPAERDLTEDFKAYLRKAQSQSGGDLLIAHLQTMEEQMYAHIERMELEEDETERRLVEGPAGQYIKQKKNIDLVAERKAGRDVGIEDIELTDQERAELEAIINNDPVLAEMEAQQERRYEEQRQQDRAVLEEYLAMVETGSFKRDPELEKLLYDIVDMPEEEEKEKEEEEEEEEEDDDEEGTKDENEQDTKKE